MAVTATTDSPTKKQLSDAGQGYNRGELYSGVALSFDGVNDYVDIGSTSQTVKTVIIWINPDTTTEKIIDFDGGTHVLEIVSGTVTATGFASATIYVDGYSDISTAAASTWTMIAATTATGFTASNMDIGRVSATYYGGDLSNCIIYSEELTAAQIAEVWKDPARPVATGLTSSDVVGWWPMDSNGTYSYILNGYANKLSGLISGATYTTTIARPVLQLAAKGQNNFYRFEHNSIYIQSSFSARVTSSNFSIAFWGSSPREKYFFKTSGTGDYFQLYFPDSTGNPYLETAKGNTPSSGYAEMLPGQLMHIVLTVDTESAVNDIILYINGVEYSVRNSIVGTFTNRTNIDFYALINEIGIYNSTLSAAEVAEIYNSGESIDLRTNTGNYISADNLTGYFRNEAKTTWTDLSDTATNGTVTGTPETYNTFAKNSTRDYLGFFLQDQAVSGVLTLNGAEYATAPTNTTLELTTAITLAAWVKFDNTGSQETIIAKNLAFELAKGSAEAVIMSVYQTSNKTLITTTTLSVDTWYYIVGTYDGTTMAVYIDGVLDDSTTSYSGAFDSTTAAVEIGRNNGSTYWTGQLDETKIYNTALTATEVLQNYRAGEADHAN